MRRAILSLSNKSGLGEFAAGLVQAGWQLLASGGTARAIREMNIPVDDVSSITRFPEILGGRVKTLHPAIHGGILARDTPSDLAELKAQKIDFIDLVVCNLYPFKETIAQNHVTLNEAIEQIDIGGVTLLRAAAKNFQRVIVICDPADYPWVLQGITSNTINFEERKKLALKAFEHTQNYDAAIVHYLKDLP